MLNRRTLRTKVLQYLFAYFNNKKVNYLQSLESIKSTFSYDLNSMETQNKKELEELRLLSSKIFMDNFDNPNYQPLFENKVHKVAQKAIQKYYHDTSKDLFLYKKNMLNEAKKVEEFYYSILHLLVSLGDAASLDQNKIHNKLSNNKLLVQIHNHNELKNKHIDEGLVWSNHMVTVRQWFKNLIKNNPYHIEYCSSEKTNFEDDKTFLLTIIKQVLFKSKTFDLYFENIDINWNQNKNIIKSLITKTIKSMNEGLEDFQLQLLSYNWEEDIEFFEQLYVKSIVIEKEYKTIIAENTKNWDISRIITTDRIMIIMAITEMLHFPSIPVKVTINEYIEIAKMYSSPKSKTFVNGILDMISKMLDDEGKIKKSGRGLIDNK